MSPRLMSFLKLTAGSVLRPFVSSLAIPILTFTVIMTVPGYGSVFEVYVVTFSCFVSFRSLRTYLDNARNAGRAHFLPDEVDDLVDQEKNFFWLNLFQHINHMGNAGKRQQFELALMMDGRGLSDTGRDILAKMDVCVSHGTFLEYKAQYINAADTAIR